jgi:hypothetical protein
MLLAMLDAVARFQPRPSCTTFTLVTDNKSIGYFCQQITMGEE